MNVNARFELSPQGPEVGVDQKTTPIHEDYQNADKTTENNLIQGVLGAPEQKYDRFARDNQKFWKNEEKKYQESVKQAELYKEISQAETDFKATNLNSDEKMREALARFKQEQSKIENPDKKTEMDSDWKNMQSSQEVTLQKKQERAEKRISPQSTSNFAFGAQLAKQPEGLALQKKETEISKAWDTQEKQQNLTLQLGRIQEALFRAEKTGDRELVSLLEEQERNLELLIKKNTQPDVSMEKKFEIGKITIESQIKQNKDIRIPDSLVEDVPFEEVTDTQKEKILMPALPTVEGQEEKKIEEIQSKTYEPSEETLSKLHEFGISYEDLLQTVPNFANLSEGQQAYVLVKAEEQSLEHIQEKANTDFATKQSESGFFKKLFKSGAMRREANRNAVNQHKGLSAFAEDIQNLTNYTIESGFDISIQENGKDRNYVIEYAKKPEGLTEKQEMFVDTYNKYATALSEIPYEWSLKTATKKQREQYEKAAEDFHKSETAVQRMLEQGGLEHADILQSTFGLRAKVELSQLFSNNLNAAKELEQFKTATWQSDLTKKIFQPATLGAAIGSGTRLLSKAMWGFGGAVGASAIIGGIMGTYRKNQEFKQDAKDARRKGISKREIDNLVNKDALYQNLSQEYQQLVGQNNPEKNKARLSELVSQMEIQQRKLTSQALGEKDTTNKVFDAKQNAERIAKLLAKIEKETDPARKEKSMQALEDRLTLLDQRMKEGRVNFGKSKEQITNKALLVEAMIEAQKVRFDLSENKKQINSRITERFEKQDSKSQDQRKKEKIKAFALGAGITGGAAAAAWLITDWFRGDNASSNIQAAIEEANLPPVQTTIPPVEIPSNPRDFEISVDASSKGAIETYANLQNEILNKYPDPTQAPEHIQEFLAKSPTALAIEDNMYRPGEVNESAKIYKGGKLGFNKAGELVYTDVRNGVDVLSGEGKFDGDHFDFKSYQEGKVSPQEFPKTETTQVSGKENLQDFWGKQQVETNIVPDVKTEVFPAEGKSIQISKDIATQLSFVEKNGKLESMITANFDTFDAYHDAYLTKDTESYAKFLATETNFSETNKLSQAQIKESLDNYINQMIARDQIIQEGKLDPSSVQYKTIQQERDILKSVINKQFVEGYSDEPLFENSTAKKYPDPNHIFETSSQNLGTGFETETSNTTGTPSTPETPEVAGPEVKSMRVRNNVIGQEFDFKFETDEQGKMTGYIENYKPSSIDQNYFKQRLGFDPDWRKASGLSQTFEDSVEGKKISNKIEIAKVALIGHDSFAPGTKEHELFKKTLIKTIEALEKDYPAIFEYKN